MLHGRAAGRRARGGLGPQGELGRSRPDEAPIAPTCGDGHAPHARIVILTYPRSFPAIPTGTGACLTLGASIARSTACCLSPGDQRFLNDEAAKLDTAVCSAVQSADVGAECVNAYNSFAACEMGVPPCAAGRSAHVSGSTVIGINPGAYHPTAEGQQILGQLINQEISNPPPTAGGP